MRYSDQPYLPVLGYDPYEVLSSILSQFSCLKTEVSPSINFLYQKTLANIVFQDKQISPISINIHQVLNWPTLPKLVMEYILYHELLHLVVPPREINGKIKSHPPEFIKIQRCSFPDADIAYAYITSILFSIIKRDNKNEQIKVLPRWRDCTAERFIAVEEFCRQNDMRITGVTFDVDADLIERIYNEEGMKYRPTIHIK